MPSATEATRPRSKDRHKARRTISYSPRVYLALQMLAEQRRVFLSAIAEDILKETLAAEDLWPVTDEQILAFVERQKRREAERDIPELPE